MIPNKVSALKKRFYVHVCSDALLKDKFTIFNSHLYICCILFISVFCRFVFILVKGSNNKF